MGEDNERVKASRQAAALARQALIEELENRKAGISAVATIIKNAQHATDVTAHYDTKAHKWTYAKPLADHNVRLKAADMTLRVFDAYPDPRIDANVKGTIIVETGIRRPGDPGYDDFAGQAAKPEGAE